MAPPQIDYSLYLVTGRELLPSGVDYYDSLEQTLQTGKVTVVQVREKDADNGEFLGIAQRSLEICDRVSVPGYEQVTATAANPHTHTNSTTSQC